jgi:hypothetical protein
MEQNQISAAEERLLMKARIKAFAVIAMVGILALVCAPQAKATVEVTLTNGASTVTVVDGGAGDSCAAVNCVTFNGALGNYIINVSTGIANNGVNPFLDLNSVNVTNTANAGLLTIATTQTGYTANAPQFSFGVGGTSTLGGNVSFAAYGGTNNTAFSTAHQIGSTLNFGTVSPFSGSTTGGGNTVNPYSLTIVASLNGVNGPGTAASFNASINAVPEPVSVSLLGGVLLLTATAIRKKLNRAA